MDNFDWEENNMCRFNCCPYYDFEHNECSRNVCIKIENNNKKEKNNEKEICRQ